MWDKINSIMLRAGYVIGPQSASAIADGDDGLWLDSTGTKLKRKNAAAPYRSSGVAILEGVIPSARMLFSAAPANDDTFTIGTKTFTYKTTLIAATTTTQIKRLATPALTLAATLDAINGVTNANVVLDTTPFTASLVADAVSATVLRIRKANVQGGYAVPGTVAATTLAASITAGASAWNVADLAAVGKEATDSKMSLFEFAVTAAMVTATSYQFELPFTPTAFSLFVTGSTGVQRASTDAATISGNAISLALGGGASPAIQAGDLVRVWAIE